jgi:hypothetical protein
MKISRPGKAASARGSQIPKSKGGSTIGGSVKTPMMGVSRRFSKSAITGKIRGAQRYK